MLLIDALYINNSGGLRLLEYLVKALEDRTADFLLLADNRCVGVFDTCRRVVYMRPSLKRRECYYQNNRNQFEKVLCFGNIPAPIKLSVPVFTYFHNINLLTLKETHSVPERAKSWLKREVFRYYKNNTDYWLVQTSNTANELIVHLRERPQKVKLMPFYELPKELVELKQVIHGNDYVYISTYVSGKGHQELLDAWKILHKRGVSIKLHLTIPTDSPFTEQIKTAQSEGVIIENHGLVPFNVVIEIYKQSKAIIYPSHNESLGLGIVEALSAGCDVIGSNLPFLHSICEPSEVFNPFSAESIADAVERYEKGKSNKSDLLIHNQIEDLIELICK